MVDLNGESPAGGAPGSPSRRAFRAKLRARVQAVLDLPDASEYQKAEGKRALAMLDALDRAPRRPNDSGADSADAMAKPEPRSPSASTNGITRVRTEEASTRHGSELVEKVVGMVILAIIVAAAFYLFPGDAFGPDDHFLPAPYR